MFINRQGHRSASLAAFIAIPLLALSLVACATTAGDVKQTPEGGGNKESSSDTSDLMSWQLDFAACMRKQGIDYPDPEEGGGGLAHSTDMDVMGAAQETCMEELGDPPTPSPEEQAIADKKFLKWAKDAAECYRENGYDMPDPDGKTLTFPSDAPPEIAEECGGGQMATRVQP